MIVGLTGGIASGKSTVAAILAELGAVIIDADVVARTTVAPGSEALRAIVRRFGPAVVGADGALNRKAMGALVMQDATARSSLEAITHPLIRIGIAQGVQSAISTGAESVFVEAALLVETGGHAVYPHLWVVICDPELQRQRLMSRKGCDAETAARWIASQMPMDQKVAKATQVIENNGSQADLRTAVEAAYRTLMEQRPDRD